MPKKQTVLIMDGQGGGVGRRIAERLLTEKLDAEFIVVGTNAVATSNMMKAGVAIGATGENAWLYNCAKADVIAGPIGIIFANAMHGEISPQMAQAVTESAAHKLLIPMANHEHRVHIAGLQDKKLQNYLDDMVFFLPSIFIKEDH